MSRFMSIMALVLVCVAFTACSSGDRATASSDDDVQVYRPAIGENRF